MKSKNNIIFYMKCLLKYCILFFIGIFAYLPLHFIREDKYPFMIYIGGIIFVITSIANSWFSFNSWGKELIWEGLLITVLICMVEIWVGFADTMFLKLDMWTYASRPLSAYNDKTCLLAFSIWNWYVLMAIITSDIIDYYYIKKYDKNNPPCYSFLRDKIFILKERK